MSCATNYLGNTCVNSCSDISVLRGLRCLELESLVFCGESRNLILSQEVKNCSCVVLTCADDVASISFIGILYICYCRTGITATFCDLTRKSVEAALNIVAKSANCIIYTVKALKNCGVYTIKALTQSLLNASPSS